MEAIIEEYRRLKLNYYLLLNKRWLEKGRVRALIGLLVWHYEEKAQEGKFDVIKVHTEALSQAIEIASSIKDNYKLKEQIEILKKEWIQRGQRSEYSWKGAPILKPPIQKIHGWERNSLNAISLFTGAMGLDLGFLAAGFNIRVANDIDPHSRDIVEENVPFIKFILKDINTVPPSELLKIASIPKGELDLLIGGPPCQPFSTAGKRRGLSDPRASPLQYFIKAIKELQPRAFVMEEVPGILSSRLKHVPINERGRRPLMPEEKPGSAFKVIMEMLESTGYNIIYGRLNAADFGAPQVRERIIFIGMREGDPSLPIPTHSGKGNLNKLPWNSFWEATLDLNEGNEGGEAFPLTPKTKGYMRYVPPGGNWRDLPPRLVEEAMGGAYFSGGGKVGFYRRLTWDEPSPTLVTTPSQKGTLFVHPILDRTLSIREYARLQGFPDDWTLYGTLSDKYRLIGNAVPTYLSYAVAMHVKLLLEGKVVEIKRGLDAYE
jgi:DNA (cytosine-5)-methyltransferase 1